jgi:hypothetical protein
MRNVQETHPDVTYVTPYVSHIQLNSWEVTTLFNTLRTGDADLRPSITTVQDR